MALTIRTSLRRRVVSSSWKKRRRKREEGISFDQYYWCSPVASLTRSYLNISLTNSLFRVERDMMWFCFGASSGDEKMDGDGFVNNCVFCDIVRGASSSTKILYSDDKVVAFPDRSPSAFRHYLVIPVKHVGTVCDLEKKDEDHQLVNHMLNVGKDLLKRDAPDSEEHRFGFHQPPFNSIDHLHLHCLALPFTQGWRHLKYTSMGRFGNVVRGFVEAEKLLDRLKP